MIKSKPFPFIHFPYILYKLFPKLTNHFIFGILSIAQSYPLIHSSDFYFCGYFTYYSQVHLRFNNIFTPIWH